MKIHEFQAKQILAAFGVPVPNGRVAASADEARAIAKEFGGKVVVKAQIHAGGRGKGGGMGHGRGMGPGCCPMGGPGDCPMVTPGGSPAPAAPAK